VTAIPLESVLFDRATCATVGFFDGVHRGHRVIVDCVVAAARESGGRSAVLTFDPAPREYLAGESIPLVTTLPEKAAILTDLGVDIVVVIPFDERMAATSAEEFVQRVVVERVGLSRMVVGYDHRFGRGGHGTVQTLRSLGETLGFQTDIVDAVESGGRPFSSRRIRAMIAAGDVAKAAVDLGRNFHISGRIVHGDKRGRLLGFPTANIEVLSTRKISPGNGVYAVWAQLPGESIRRAAVLNLGHRPTVSDGVKRVMEMFILDYKGDLYGEVVGVDFVKRLRTEKKFDSIDELRSQIAVDAAICHSTLLSVS